MWKLGGWWETCVWRIATSRVLRSISYIPRTHHPLFVHVLRFDAEGQALDGVSISDLKSGGVGGGNTNWKTLYEVKSENLGQGDKVPGIPNHLHRGLQSVQEDRFRNLTSDTSCQSYNSYPGL